MHISLLSARPRLERLTLAARSERITEVPRQDSDAARPGEARLELAEQNSVTDDDGMIFDNRGPEAHALIAELFAVRVDLGANDQDYRKRRRPEANECRTLDRLWSPRNRSECRAAFSGRDFRAPGSSTSLSTRTLSLAAATRGDIHVGALGPVDIHLRASKAATR